MFMGLFTPTLQPWCWWCSQLKQLFFPWSWLWYATAALVCTPNFLQVLCFLLHTGALLQLVCFLLASHLLLAHHFLLARHLLPGLEEAPELGCSHVGQVSTLQPKAQLTFHIAHPPSLWQGSFHGTRALFVSRPSFQNQKRLWPHILQGHQAVQPKEFPISAQLQRLSSLQPSNLAGQQSYPA